MAQVGGLSRIVGIAGLTLAGVACAAPNPRGMPECSADPAFHLVIDEGSEVVDAAGMPCSLHRPQRLDIRYGFGAGFGLPEATAECNGAGGAPVLPLVDPSELVCRTVDY